MARHDYNILNQLFAATRQDLNSLFLAMQSTNSGAGTPSDTVAYMRFIDTSAGEILIRNASDTGSISLRKTTGEVIAPLGSATGASYSFGTDFNTGLFSPGANTVALTTSGIERLRIDSSGNVGIGTTNPLSPLYIDTAYTLATNTAQFYIKNTSTGQSACIALEAVSTNGSAGNKGAIYFSAGATGSSSDNRIDFNANHQTSTTSAMTILGSGNVSIGTTGPYNNCNLTIYQQVSTQADRLLAIQTQVTTASYAVQFVNPNGRVGTISTSGTSTAYNTSSDYRLKENIQEIENPIDRFMKLKPCTFNFIKDKEKVVDGFLAHELQEVIPESVTGVKDEEDEDGEPIYQGIDQAKIVPLLVATVQNLIKRIEALEGK
jgi:hypothetical protein